MNDQENYWSAPNPLTSARPHPAGEMPLGTQTAIGRVLEGQASCQIDSELASIAPPTQDIDVLAKEHVWDEKSPESKMDLSGGQGITGPPHGNDDTGGLGKRQHQLLPVGADPIIREPECRVLTGLSKTTRWRMERAGQFPGRIRLSANACGWRLSAINAWLVGRETG